MGKIDYQRLYECTVKMDNGISMQRGEGNSFAIVMTILGIIRYTNNNLIFVYVRNFHCINHMNQQIKEAIEIEKYYLTLHGSSTKYNLIFDTNTILFRLNRAETEMEERGIINAKTVHKFEDNSFTYF